MIEDSFLRSRPTTYKEHPHIEWIIKSLQYLALEYEKITGKPMDQKYYVCNQDEPYAQKVIDIIIEGETEKEKR